MFQLNSFWEFIILPVRDELAKFVYGKIYSWSRGISGSVVSDYGLDDRGSIPDKGRGIFF
jgi:hypothetical protein